MGKKWIYRLKTEDFAYVAERLNIALEGRTDDKRKAFSEYYSETENDPKLAGIWVELEAAYPEEIAPSITLTPAEEEDLLASLSIDNMQQEAQKRVPSPQKRNTEGAQKTAAPVRTPTSTPSQPDYAKVAKQVREWSFKFDGIEKPFEFLEQVEWSANTYGLDLDMIPRAMPELMKGRALKWFISNNKQWQTWAEFIQSFNTYFLPRDFFSTLSDKVKQRKQGYGEAFKDYMIDIRPLSYSPTESLNIIRQNCTPSLKIALRAYTVADLDTLMDLADEFEELEKERETFAQENKFARAKPAAQAQITCRRCEDTGDQETQAANKPLVEATNHNAETTGEHPHHRPPGGLPKVRRPRALRTRLSKPAFVVLLGVRQSGYQERRALPRSGKWSAISAAERRAGIAKCFLSKLTGKLIEEEQQLSAAVTIGGGTYKATIDTGATASFISEELADSLAALGKITRTRRQVRLADGRCGGINAQLEVEIAFGNKRLTMSLLILPGVVDSLVLGWNFLTQVGTEIKCAGHEIKIPARTRHNGWLEEKLSVAVMQETTEDNDTTEFLEKELADFNTMTGTSNMAEHQITMKDDKPIKQRYYPKNPKVQGEINAKVDELLQMGFIEHSKSQYSSPIVMVRKKTGKWRLCVDFRQINAKSVKDAYPMPRINYILDQLKEARYISSLDLKDGYWQIPLEESSRQYTAFTVPGKGLFQWRVMPFGLHSASATFQRVLDQVIGPEMSPHAFAYQDDIIVIGRTLEEHTENLKEVFRRLKEANLRTNPEKYPEKVAAIAELEPPSIVKELRQYLGVASWYRRFVPGFAKIVKPLNDLLCKGSKWEWTQEHQMAFEEVKARLVADPVLACPDFNKTFTLQTDASDYGIGAILTQDTERGEKVISYSSRTLNGA
ncbi:uncharacterized protein [Drosophila takahashii]|uniref:uncharacterized protein n=1 Tax=Drosophila takahashii TaxID=29030 RepID=UPI0038993782